MPRSCATCQGAGTVGRNAGGFAFADPCPDCRGRGMIVDDPCPDCHGSGKALSDRAVSVRLPAGVTDGKKVRIRGKGAPGERGGPAGDLLVLVHVRPHPVFARSGDNLTVTVPVTFTEAVLGATITVPTLDGKTVSVKLAPGTSNGRTLRVRGKGAPRKGGGAGDLLVTIAVHVPSHVTDEAAAALRQFAETTDEDVRGPLLERARHE
jgi:molecular chaperone DnaJ